MSAYPFAVVDRPADDGRKPHGFFRDLIDKLGDLPDDKALSVPASVAGKSFRASVCGAATKAGVGVSVRKGDGCFVVMKRA